MQVVYGISTKCAVRRKGAKMQKDVEAGARSGIGAGLGGLLGTAIGMGPGSKKFAASGLSKLQQQLIGGGTGLALGSTLGSGISSPNIETTVGSTIGGGLGMGAGALAAFPKAGTQSSLLKYLLGMGIGSTAGSAIGGGLAHATGVTPALQRLFSDGEKIDVAAMTPEERMKMFGREVYPA